MNACMLPSNDSTRRAWQTRSQFKVRTVIISDINLLSLIFQP